MKKEVSTLAELYVKIAQKIAEYCQATAEQRTLRTLPVQEYLERKKQIIACQVKKVLTKIKSKLTQEEIERDSYTVPERFNGPKDGLKDIFKWLNPSYSYLTFLQHIRKNSVKIFTSQYEEIEIKRKVLKYFKQFTHRTVNSSISPSTSEYSELANRSYCIPCRRVICNKMTGRHNMSKKHLQSKPVYLRVSEAQGMQINSQFVRIIRRNKMHLRHLMQRQLKTKPKFISLEMYPNKNPLQKDKEPVCNIKYTCIICKKSYSMEISFMRHFEQRDHIAKLKSFGIRNPKEYIGLTTEDAVRARQRVYFSAGSE